MDENNLYPAPEAPDQGPEKKPMHVASLVLGILSIVFAILLPLIGDILGLLSIVLASVRRRDYKTRAGLICGIVGLVLSIANHVFTATYLLPLLSQMGSSGFTLTM